MAAEDLGEYPSKSSSGGALEETGKTSRTGPQFLIESCVDVPLKSCGLGVVICTAC